MQRSATIQASPEKISRSSTTCSAGASGRRGKGSIPLSSAATALVPQGNATQVTWSMYGPNSFTGKLIGAFVSMDRMVGGKFEEGLANLKSVAEK